MGKTDENDVLVPGCEICTGDDLAERGFHFNKRLFLEESSSHRSKRNPRSWSLSKGIVGSSPNSTVFVNRVEGVAEKHAEILWDSKSDEYDIRDLGSSSGTYILVSCTRPSRETTQIHTGDIIYLAKADRRSSRRQTSTIGAPFAQKDSLDFNNYIQIRVKALKPDVVEEKSYVIKKERKSRAYTLRRDSDCAPMPNLPASRIDEINLAGIREGFERAAKAFEASSGVLMKENTATELREKNKNVKVTFVAVTDEQGNQNEFKRNTLGGASVFEEESSLDSILCDGTVSKAQLLALEKSARGEGIPIKNMKKNNNGDENQDEVGDREVSDSSGSIRRAQTFSPNVVNIERQIEECFVELEIISGTNRLNGKTFSFGLSDISIGSHRSNKLCIEELSSFHIRVERNEKNHFWIRDLSMGLSCGTFLQLLGNRVVTLQKHDVIRIGPTLELTVREAIDHPDRVSEYWDNLGLKVVKARQSLRYRQLTTASGYMFEPKYFAMSSSDELTIGRKVFECDIAVQDYEMPAFAAVINRFENRYFISALPESKKKGVFLELSSRSRNFAGAQFGTRTQSRVGRIHCLQKGDTFRVGRSQLSVLIKKSETEQEWTENVARAYETISRVRLFSCLKANEYQNLASASCFLEFEKGDIIIRQSEIVTGIILIAQGSAEVYHEHNPSRIINRVSDNALLGEMALFTGLPASASIKASENTKCLYIDYNLARTFIHPNNFELIRILIETRVSQSHVYDLKNIPALKSLGNNQLIVLSTLMFRVILERGCTFIEKGDEQDTMYIVGSGTLFISDQDSGKNLSVRPLEKRRSFSPVYGGGHVLDAILSHKGDDPYISKVSITCSGFTVLYGLKRKDFEQVMSMSPEDASSEAKKAKDIIKELVAKTETVTPIGGMSFGSKVGSKVDGVLGSVHSFASSYHEPQTPTSFQMMGSAKVSPLDSTASYEFSTVHLSKKARRTSAGSVSEGEGEEGAALSLGYSPSSEATVDSFESDFNDEELDFAKPEDSAFGIFSKPTETEQAIQSATIGEMETELRKHPFYIVLKCISGPQKRQVFVITDSLTIVGRWTTTERDDDCNPFPGRRFISLNDRTVSRVNSMIMYRNGDFFLNDLNSKFGTHLKMKQNVDYKLEVGDVVSCSQHEFTIYGRCKVVPSKSASKCCSIS